MLSVKSFSLKILSKKEEKEFRSDFSSLHNLKYIKIDDFKVIDKLTDQELFEMFWLIDLNLIKTCSKNSYTSLSNDESTIIYYKGSKEEFQKM